MRELPTRRTPLLANTSSSSSSGADCGERSESLGGRGWGGRPSGNHRGCRNSFIRGAGSLLKVLLIVVCMSELMVHSPSTTALVSAGAPLPPASINNDRCKIEDAGVLIASGSDGAVIGLDMASGEVMWQKDTGGALVKSSTGDTHFLPGYKTANDFGNTNLETNSIDFYVQDGGSFHKQGKLDDIVGQPPNPDIIATKSVTEFSVDCRTGLPPVDASPPSSVLDVMRYDYTVTVKGKGRGSRRGEGSTSTSGGRPRGSVQTVGIVNIFQANTPSDSDSVTSPVQDVKGMGIPTQVALRKGFAESFNHPDERGDPGTPAEAFLKPNIIATADGDVFCLSPIQAASPKSRKASASANKEQLIWRASLKSKPVKLYLLQDGLLSELEIVLRPIDDILREAGFAEGKRQQTEQQTHQGIPEPDDAALIPFDPIAAYVGEYYNPDAGLGVDEDDEGQTEDTLSFPSAQTGGKSSSQDIYEIGSPSFPRDGVAGGFGEAFRSQALSSGVDIACTSSVEGQLYIQTTIRAESVIAAATRQQQTSRVFPFAVRGEGGAAQQQGTLPPYRPEIPNKVLAIRSDSLKEPPVAEGAGMGGRGFAGILEPLHIYYLPTAYQAAEQEGGSAVATIPEDRRIEGPVDCGVPVHDSDDDIGAFLSEVGPGGVPVGSGQPTAAFSIEQQRRELEDTYQNASPSGGMSTILGRFAGAAATFRFAAVFSALLAIAATLFYRVNMWRRQQQHNRLRAEIASPCTAATATTTTTTPPTNTPGVSPPTGPEGCAAIPPSLPDVVEKSSGGESSGVTVPAAAAPAALPTPSPDAGAGVLVVGAGPSSPAPSSNSNGLVSPEKVLPVEYLGGGVPPAGSPATPLPCGELAEGGWPNRQSSSTSPTMPSVSPSQLPIGMDSEPAPMKLTARGGYAAVTAELPGEPSQHDMVPGGGSDTLPYHSISRLVSKSTSISELDVTTMRELEATGTLAVTPPLSGQARENPFPAAGPTQQNPDTEAAHHSAYPEGVGDAPPNGAIPGGAQADQGTATVGSTAAMSRSSGGGACLEVGEGDADTVLLAEDTEEPAAAEVAKVAGAEVEEGAPPVGQPEGEGESSSESTSSSSSSSSSTESSDDSASKFFKAKRRVQAARDAGASPAVAPKQQQQHHPAASPPLAPRVGAGLCHTPNHNAAGEASSSSSTSGTSGNSTSCETSTSSEGSREKKPNRRRHMSHSPESLRQQRRAASSDDEPGAIPGPPAPGRGAGFAAVWRGGAASAPNSPGKLGAAGGGGVVGDGRDDSSKRSAASSGVERMARRQSAKRRRNRRECAKRQEAEGSSTSSHCDDENSADSRQPSFAHTRDETCDTEESESVMSAERQQCGRGFPARHRNSASSSSKPGQAGQRKRKAKRPPELESVEVFPTANSSSSSSSSVSNLAEAKPAVKGASSPASKASKNGASVSPACHSQHRHHDSDSTREGVRCSTASAPSKTPGSAKPVPYSDILPDLLCHSGDGEGCGSDELLEGSDEDPNALEGRELSEAEEMLLLGDPLDMGFLESAAAKRGGPKKKGKKDGAAKKEGKKSGKGLKGSTPGAGPQQLGPENNSSNSNSNGTQNGNSHGLTSMSSSYVKSPAHQPQYSSAVTQPSTEVVNSPATPFSTYRQLYIEKGIIGGGGYGTVWLAENITDKKHYAVKKIRLKDETNQDNIEENEKTKREAALHSALDHPNIARYNMSWVEELSFEEAAKVDHRMQRNDSLSNLASMSQTHTLAAAAALINPTARYKHLFIVMKFYEEGSLKDWLISRAAVDRRQNLKYLLQLSEGLRHLHANEVLHRDMKPSNILVEKVGKSNTIQLKICDFGLSVMKKITLDQLDPQASVGPSFTGAAGTPLYSSPEQNLPGAKIGKPSDIFSLGLVFYELFLESLPYSDKIRCFNPLREKNRDERSCIIDANIRSLYAPEMQLVLDMTKLKPEQRITLKEVKQRCRELLRELKRDPARQDADIDAADADAYASAPPEPSSTLTESVLGATDNSPLTVQSTVQSIPALDGAQPHDASSSSSSESYTDDSSDTA